MSVLVSSPAEALHNTPSDPAVALFESVRACNEAVPDVMPAIRKIIAEHVGTAATKSIQDTISVAAGILDWQMTRKLGGRLPPGLIKVSPENERGVTVKQDTSY